MQGKVYDILRKIDAASPKGHVSALHLGFHVPRFLLQTFPVEWTDLYSDKGLMLRDPVLLWGMSNVGTKRWSELPGAADNDVMIEAGNYGLSFGMVCAIEENNSRSICSTAREDREFTDTELKELSGLFTELHNATVDLQDMSGGLKDELHALTVRLTQTG